MEAVTELSPRKLAAFEAAVEHVGKCSLTQKQRLTLAGIYKHITEGPCPTNASTTSKMLAIASSSNAKIKHEAWKSCKDLSVEQAMDKFVDLLRQCDPSFIVPEVPIEKSLLKTKEIEELDSLPPPVPPLVQTKYSRLKSKSANVIQEIRNQSGFDPENNQLDNEARILLHEKLVKFYRAVDPNRLVNGIGELVDFGMTAGEESLNSRLRKKYGIDLQEMEEKEQRRLSGVHKKISSKEPTVNATEQLRRATYAKLEMNEALELSHTIEQFFLEFDPEKVALGKETGFIELIKYCDKRGVPALNKKLMAKYGKSLEHVKRNSYSPPAESKEKSDTQMPLVVVENQGNNNNVGRLESANSLLNMKITDSFTDLRQSDPDGNNPNRIDSKQSNTGAVNLIELPDYVRPALVNFYNRYEQERLKDGGVQKIYSWAKRNGLRKLNLELKRRYKQSLDEFVEDSEKLKDELAAFYKKIDSSKFENADFEKIVTWGIKNGRVALNMKLQKKYGFDLETYELQDTIDKTLAVDETVEF